jgi:hypothetical protein
VRGPDAARFSVAPWNHYANAFCLTSGRCFRLIQAEDAMGQPSIARTPWFGEVGSRMELPVGTPGMPN